MSAVRPPRLPLFSNAGRLIYLGAASLGAMQCAVQTYAWVYAQAPALGARLMAGGVAFYPPWALVVWADRFGMGEPGLSLALLAFVAAFSLAMAPFLMVGVLAHRRGWGGLADAKRAGLLDDEGCILGRLHGRMLSTRDLRPSLITGGTRSGKGRGHVIPSLLSWTHSVLVHDPKGELWRVTAGWRSGFSHVLRFAPRDLASVRFNPLAEIRPGPQQLSQVRRLTSILSDPGGAREDEAIWDKAACEILEAVVLHVLYTAKDEEKTLLKVRDLLGDLDATAEIMARTLHGVGPAGRGETDPFIALATKGYAAMHDRFRTSVQGTARSYLSWLAGEDLEQALSCSDFSLSDLMCAEAPVSLYVEVSPADASALRPLVRLLFSAAAQSLTAIEKQDVSGRPKRRPLLLLMDEFPLLGRLAFFEKTLRLLSGYGVKTMLVAQSLNDIIETYGPHNTILDNCHVYTAFSALDPLTQEKVSKLTGTVFQKRLTRSGPAGLGAGRSSVSRSEIERPLLQPGEIRALGDDFQLTFVAGYKPFLTRKLRYDESRLFRGRADRPPPDARSGVDTPGRPPHPWAGRRSLGEDDSAALPLFKEAEAAIHERRAAGKAAETYETIISDFAAQQAALDHLQGAGQ